ncbi:MAG: hypothetical protein ACJAUV_001739 [Flavobacteriales bacterium]|jgi:hypothetical protein
MLLIYKSLMFKTLYCVLLIAFSGQSYAQGTKFKAVLCDLNTIEHNIQIAKDSYGITYGTDSIVRLVAKINERVESIKHCKFSQVFSNRKIHAQKAFYKSWLHVTSALNMYQMQVVLLADTALNKHTTIEGGKWEYNDDLNPWISDVYNLNTKPILEKIAFLTVLNSLREFEDECEYMRNKGKLIN